MMKNGPFVRNRRTNHASPRFRSPTLRTIPVQNESSPAPKPDQKVDSITIHFVGSEKTRLASAVTIQKVYRGFWVRKILKRIFAIGNEVDEMQRRFSDSSTLQSIRRDPKERLKANERLMALLFQLDSVPGIDAGIRVCRKAVIKNAIALQDLVDGPVIEDLDVEEKDSSENYDDIPLSSNPTLEQSTVQSYESGISLEPTADRAEGVTVLAVDEIAPDSVLSKENRDVQKLMDLVEIPDNDHEVKTIPVVCCVEKRVIDPSLSVEESKGRCFEGSKSSQSGCMQENCRGGYGNLENNCSDSVAEKMARDNEILMSLVKDLCKKNDLQTKLLGALSRRVENLEKGLMRKKKKHRSGETADGAAKENHK